MVHQWMLVLVFHWWTANTFPPLFFLKKEPQNARLGAPQRVMNACVPVAHLLAHPKMQSTHAHACAPPRPSHQGTRAAQSFGEPARPEAAGNNANTNWPTPAATHGGSRRAGSALVRGSIAAGGLPGQRQPHRSASGGDGPPRGPGRGVPLQGTEAAFAGWDP